MKQPLAALCAAAILALSACGDDSPEQPEPTTDEPQATTEAPTPAESTSELTVGGLTYVTITAGDTEFDFDVTAVEAKVVDTRDVAGDDGYVIDIVEFGVDITVHSGELDFMPSGASLWITPTLIAADGTEYEATVYAADQQFPSAIAADESATGAIGFEAPTSAAEAGVLRVEFGLSGDAIHEWTY